MELINIRIPGEIKSFERGLFADPLNDRLMDAGVGEIVEEGTHLDHIEGKQVIVGCELVVEAADLQKALGIVVKTLKEHGVTREAILSFGSDESKTVRRLGDC